jgi:hypothetical protein
VKRLTPLRLAAQMCREPACKVSQEPLIRRHRLKHAATSAHTRLPQSKRPMAINARVSGHTTHKSLPYGKDQRALMQPISDFIDAFAKASMRRCFESISSMHHRYHACRRDEPVC